MCELDILYLSLEFGDIFTGEIKGIGRKGEENHYRTQPAGPIKMTSGEGDRNKILIRGPPENDVPATQFSCACPTREVLCGSQKTSAASSALKWPVGKSRTGDSVAGVFGDTHLPPGLVRWEVRPPPAVWASRIIPW